MTTTLTLYPVCNNAHGSPFNPVGSTMTSNKREALAELRERRQYDPDSYLAQITSKRLPEAQKGR
jgi:hypothetical protein